jgi:hypothetical protein
MDQVVAQSLALYKKLVHKETGERQPVNGHLAGK